ncbi:MAG TPA: lipase, partial [Bacteroidales bacterium]|nr:lipase [Bacteroidales bacterium]
MKNKINKTMFNRLSITIISLLILYVCCSAQSEIKTGLPSNDYLNNIKDEMDKKWPENRTINLVFHGHSVPAGYYETPIVNTLESYPFLVLKKLKNIYPNAVINVITTAIGGENSVQGAKRFTEEVLTHNPDLIFIDYALNDIFIGMDKSYTA